MADLILTNPPFGPAGRRPSRDDLTVSSNVSSYQLPFVEHCIRALKPGGRAAAELSKLIEAFVRALEASEFDQRLRAIEAKGDATRP